MKINHWLLFSCSKGGIHFKNTPSFAGFGFFSADQWKMGLYFLEKFMTILLDFSFTSGNKLHTAKRYFLCYINL